jgi:hypothetical protein
MRMILAALALVSVTGLAHAGEACEARAMDKNGKPLAGAAKSSFIKKCERTSVVSACAAKAVDKNGKPLAGAAKNSSIKKCEKDMVAGAAPAASN